MFHEYSSLHFAHMKAFQGDDMEEEKRDKREGGSEATNKDRPLSRFISSPLQSNSHSMKLVSFSEGPIQ